MLLIQVSTEFLIVLKPPIRPTGQEEVSESPFPEFREMCDRLRVVRWSARVGAVRHLGEMPAGPAAQMKEGGVPLTHHQQIRRGRQLVVEESRQCEERQCEERQCKEPSD